MISAYKDLTGFQNLSGLIALIYLKVYTYQQYIQRR